MKESNSRREFLSQSGKMVTAAALFGAVARSRMLLILSGTPAGRRAQ